MKASDVTDTLKLALDASGCDQAHVRHKPRLLIDNGSSYISGNLTSLDDRKMTRVRGAPYRPQTQAKHHPPSPLFQARCLNRYPRRSQQSADLSPRLPKCSE